ncbi:MAG: NfeD family protein [Clostridiales bacterium]|nr:NfeD family protein [Clostridiales bacterium]
MLELITANLPIIVCFVVGIGLLILEAFMPGFGAPGITGVILEIITLVMTWFEHGPLATLGMLLIVLLVLAIAISTSLRSIISGRLSKSSLVHSATESNEEGYRSVEDLAVFMDREGVASSVLRPTGIADFDGVRLNVSSEGDYIPAGTKVRIIKVEGAKILVRAL